jgi:hypothetical protein
MNTEIYLNTVRERNFTVVLNDSLLFIVVEDFMIENN